MSLKTVNRFYTGYPFIIELQTSNQKTWNIMEFIYFFNNHEMLLKFEQKSFKNLEISTISCEYP